MKNQIHSINWFEIPVLDFNRAKTFYSTLYAFEMEVMEMGPDKMGILPTDPEKGGVSGAIILEKTTDPMQMVLKYTSTVILISITFWVELKLLEGR